MQINRGDKKQACRSVTVFLVTMCLWLLVAPPTRAQDIGAEFSVVQNTRRDLEELRLGHEEDSRSLQERLRIAEISFRECRSGRWRVAWTDRVQEVEDAREDLEEQNAQLIMLNRNLQRQNNELEGERLAIEDRRLNDSSRYPGEFREWMGRINFEYLWRLENQLFPGYEDYHHGIGEYIDLVSRWAVACEERDYGPAVVEQFIAGIDRISGFAAAIGARLLLRRRMQPSSG